VLVSGNEPGSRPIAGISTTGNKGYGVSVSGQKDVEVRDLTLSGDQAGGLELNRVSDSKVHNVRTTDEPNGVFLHVNSANVQLDAMAINGGRNRDPGREDHQGPAGDRIDDRRRPRLRVRNRRQGTQIDGLTVKNSRTAVRVERGAGDVNATNMTLIGGDDGLVTSGGSTGVVVKNLSTDGVDNALRKPELRACRSRRHHPRRPHRDGPAGGHDRQRHPGRAHHHGHPRPGGRADRAPSRDRRRGVGRRRVPAGNRGHAADSSVHALEAVRGQVTLLANQRPQPSAAELARRDRAAADRACRDAGGRAPPALAADRPDAARAAAPVPVGAG
jgi:hypothetical protein